MRIADCAAAAAGGGRVVVPERPRGRGMSDVPKRRVNVIGDIGVSGYG